MDFTLFSVSVPYLQKGLSVHTANTEYDQIINLTIRRCSSCASSCGGSWGGSCGGSSCGGSGGSRSSSGGGSGGSRRGIE